MNKVTNNQSTLEKLSNPFLQGATVLILVFLFMLLAKLLKWSGIITINDTFPWTIAVSFILFFALFNSIISLSSADIDRYFKQSMLAFIGLAAFSGGLAMLLSSAGAEDIGPYKSIFTVFTIGYLVFISIIGFMKRIVDFAQNEEWQKPRRRK